MYKKIYKSMQIMSLVIILLTAVLVITSSYSIYNLRLKNELKSETTLIKNICDTFLNSDNFYDELKKLEIDKSFVISSHDNEIIYTNDKNITKEDMVKIYNEQNLLKDLNSPTYYYTQRLANDNNLTVLYSTNSLITLFRTLVLPILLVLGLMYLLCVIFAVNLTQSIIKPISDINLYDDNLDNTYEELTPILKRIKGQNAEIKRQVDKVNRHRLRLQMISENMSEGLLVLNNKREIISSNFSANNILGIYSREFTYCKISEIDCFSTISAYIEDSYLGNKTSAVISIAENAYRFFFSPVFEETEVSGVIVLILDINEEEKMSAIRREFSANVSHELKTPLTTILGYSQIINNEIARPEDVKSFTEKIEKEATRLITLIDDIIKLSKLDESIDCDEKKNVSILNIIKSVGESLSDKAKKRGIEITINGDDFSIIGNEGQLNELVYNLFDNAIKYNSDNGKISIYLSDKKFTITDTGIGIPKEYLARIFERFFRVDKSHSKKVNGTGLGLSIVKHIAMCHNAKINVESTVGLGTTFEVSFNE